MKPILFLYHLHLKRPREPAFNQQLAVAAVTSEGNAPPTKKRRGRPRKNPQPPAVLTAPHSDTDEQITNDDEDMDDDGQSIALSDLRFPLSKTRAGRPAEPKPCNLYKYTTSQKPFEKKPKEEQTMSMCLHYFQLTYTLNNY